METNITDLHRKVLDPILSKQVSKPITGPDLGGCGVTDCGTTRCMLKSGSYEFCDYWQRHASRIASSYPGRTQA